MSQLMQQYADVLDARFWVEQNYRSARAKIDHALRHHSEPEADAKQAADERAAHLTLV